MTLDKSELCIPTISQKLIIYGYYTTVQLIKVSTYVLIDLCVSKVTSDE